MSVSNNSNSEQIDNHTEQEHRHNWVNNCTLSPPNELILKWAHLRPNDIYLKQIIERQTKTYTFSEVAEHALKLVSALEHMGAQPRDKIALISKNCAEWFICDLAMTLGDFVSVPIFPTANAETIEYCLTHSETRFVIIGKLDKSDAVVEVLRSLNDLTSIALPYAEDIQCDHRYNDLLATHQPSFTRPNHHDDTIMSIVYTSGTSGKPKGAMLSYGAFNWTVNQLTTTIAINENDRLFSYLPLAHITERVYIYGSSLLLGVETAFPESLDTFIEDIKMQRPTLFVSVPRLWTLFQQKIQEKLPPRKLNLLLKIPIISSIVKYQIAKNLGLNCAHVLGCGSAPVSPALLKWYEQIGLPIVEAWGMTETLAYSTLNYPYKKDRVGSVGIAGAGVELKIGADQEILVRSFGLFSGYYKNEQATLAAFDADGWLRTGDIGTIDEQGYLSIIGRSNDTFKTAKGKFVSPVAIEKRILEYSRVEMLCLIGSGLPAPILLVNPHNFTHFDRERYERTAHKIIRKINNSLQSHEQIKGVLMIKEPWTIENNILTPTLKIKRHMLEKKYHQIGQDWPKDRLILWEE
jgi:long-subunit acyl-CoA synthetase (AMP-forming)